MIYIHILIAENVIRKDEMPVAFKIYWGLHNTAMVTAFVITIIYWTVLHKGNIGLLTHSQKPEKKKESVTKCRPTNFSHSRNGIECNKYSFACHEFSHYVRGSVNCGISTPSAACHSTDRIWSYFWILFIYLLFVRWQKHVRIPLFRSIIWFVIPKNSFILFFSFADLVNRSFILYWIGQHPAKL